MKIREIAGGLHFPEGPVALGDGSILVVEIATGFLTRITQSGRLQRLVHVGGGPNGAALGPDGAIYVCNNGGMEFFLSPDGHTLRPGPQPKNYSGGDYSPIEGLVVRKGSPVRDFKELKGKKVTYAAGSSQHLAHLIALRRAGMNINDIEAVPLAPPQGLDIAV